MLCVVLWSLMPASLVGRIARLAALASLSALLALWTSYVMSRLVVIDACVFGAAPSEASCAAMLLLMFVSVAML